MSASPSEAEADVDLPSQAETVVQGTLVDEEAPQNIYANIFGDDDEDLSDDEAQPAEGHQEAGQDGKDDDDDETNEDEADKQEEMDNDKNDDDEDDGRGEEDVYVPGTTANPAKIPKFKKKRREEDDEDVDDDDQDREERKRKRKEKKEKRRKRDRLVAEGGDEEETQRVVTAEEERRLRLEDRIDNIGKKAKVVRRKKKGDDDVDIVDSFHDDVCARLRDRMIAAADKDRQSNDNKLPATAKLAMLDEVMSVLRNTTLWQSIVDNGVLDAVRQWLEPIAPSGALPAVGIQKAIFEVLPKMDLDTQTLKECRLGPIVLFYTKTKRVTPAINRQADALVQAWSRPIIKRPANLRSRYVETLDEAVENSQRREDDADMDEREPPRRPAPVKKKRFDVMSAVEDNKGRKGARLFINRDVQYTVAPESQLQHRSEDITQVSRIQMDNKKFNRFARQMKTRGGR